MEIVHKDIIAPLEPDSIETDSLETLLSSVAEIEWAAERELYANSQSDFLFPFESLHLTPPSDNPLLPPEQQDNKLDFVKQNVREFCLGDTYFVRGWVHSRLPEDTCYPFLKVSYRGGPETALSAAAGNKLGSEIKLDLQYLGTCEELRVPYNRISHRYDIEIWGCSAREMEVQFGPKAAAAVDIGAIQFRPNIIRGNYDAFSRDLIAGASVWDVATDHLLHPLKPLRIAYAWRDRDTTLRDPQDGTSYVCEFNSLIRGWDRFESAGTSANTHGGSGSMRYSNLLSNYGQAKERVQLGRSLEPWMFNSLGSKSGVRKEQFFSVDYVDMHVLEPSASIGIHRHRDNQEILFVLSGSGMLISGDWCQFPDRQRAFQVQTLLQGHFGMVKSGGLHGFKNVSDRPVQILMLGGYD